MDVRLPHRDVATDKVIRRGDPRRHVAVRGQERGAAKHQANSNLATQRLLHW